MKNSPYKIIAAALIISACFCAPPQGFARAGASNINSQVRYEGEDYLDAMKRSRAAKDLLPPGAKSALGAAAPYSLADLSGVPEVDNFGTLMKSFTEVRDARFLLSPDRPGFLRRLTWLYPDEGCFARAAMMGKKLEEWNYVRPRKVFAFGNLRVKTPNSPAGSVNWWYHVVPVVSVNKELYVYDPAIDPGRPMPLRDWVSSMVEPGTDLDAVKVSVCTPYTYGPYNNCFESQPVLDILAETDQKDYLKPEWNRVKGMGRDPERLLGDAPPWLAPAAVEVSPEDGAVSRGTFVEALLGNISGDLNFDGAAAR